MGSISPFFAEQFSRIESHTQKFLGGEGQHFPLFGQKLRSGAANPNFWKNGQNFSPPPKKLGPTVLEDVVPGVMMQIFAQYAPGATRTVWGEEKGGGGQVRGTDAHPAEPLL